MRLIRMGVSMKARRGTVRGRAGVSLSIMMGPVMKANGKRIRFMAEGSYIILIIK
jgi:hypothetical protein